MSRQVAIYMGSKSDLPVMQGAADTLKELGIECSMNVASAHRTPEFLTGLLKSAEEEGVKVFIAGAGAAAHLAGVIASKTTKPVIGVPIMSKLSGLDSLLSTVQMPSGIPVATVAVDGAKNAGFLAASILSIQDEQIAKRIEENRAARADKITSDSNLAV